MRSDRKGRKLKQQIEIGSRLVGVGQPAYVVAEIGLNHNGDLRLALETITAAKSAGADAVKFQNYETDDFITDRTLTWRYRNGDREVEETQYDMFKRCELSRRDLAAIAEHCRHISIDMHSTPTGVSGIKTLVDLGVGVLKNGSDFLGNLPLVAAMGRTGLPTVLSTGMATLSDIDQAVQAFVASGNQQLIILHCTSSYPTPPQHAHLRRLSTLRAAFGTPVGFSDHTEGTTAAMLSIAFGACWIEKHFTLDRALPGPDHAMSMDPVGFAGLAGAVRDAERMLGEAAVFPAEVDPDGRSKYRLSCSAARDIAKGEKIAEGDVAFQRPGTGFPPSSADLITGLDLKRSIRRGEMFTKEHFVG
jgi:N-acetylneuraminate synthase/N,N'-diacetyllegionaminate synthase